MFNSHSNKEFVWDILKEQSILPINQQWRDVFEQLIPRRKVVRISPHIH